VRWRRVYGEEEEEDETLEIEDERV